MATAELAVRTTSELIKEMKPALREVYDDCARLKEQHHISEVLAFYDIGVQVDTVLKDKDQNKYGDNAAGVLAAALGINHGYLYRLRELSQVWDREKLEAASKKYVKGTRDTLSLSHFVEIATLDDGIKNKAAVRKNLLARCYSEGLSVAAVQRIKKELSGGLKTAKSTKVRPFTVSAGLNSMRKVGQKLLNEAEGWESAVFETFEQADTMRNWANDETLEKVEQALETQQSVQAQVDITVKRLITARDNLRRSVVSKTVDKLDAEDTADDDEYEDDAAPDEENEPQAPSTVLFPAKKKKKKQKGLSSLKRKLLGQQPS